MAFFWTIRSLPELAHLSDDDRQRLLRACGARQVMFALIRRSLLFATIVWLVVWALTAILVDSMPSSSCAVIGGIAGAAGFVACFQWVIRIIRWDIRQSIVEGFAGQKLPACLRCGYDLAGINGDQCPECGGNVRVRGTKPRTALNKESDDAALD